MRDDKSSSKSLFYGISYDIIVTFSRIQVIRKLRAIVFQIKAQAAMENHEGEDKNK